VPLPEDKKPSFETDDRFPSGPWVGYFLQFDVQSRTELALTFADGVISGTGGDWVGSFVIHGRYQTSDGKCWWTKRYLGKHEVAYQGWSECRGIWGRWEIPRIGRGGFHIWPKGLEEADVLRAEHEAPEAIAWFDEEPFAVPHRLENGSGLIGDYGVVFSSWRCR
jgi:hypothetical protein